MARQHSTRPRAVAKRVSTALSGGGARHRKAEERRDSICRTVHIWEDDADVRPANVYAWLAGWYKISASTVRSIHRQHCRLKPKGAA